MQYGCKTDWTPCSPKGCCIEAFRTVVQKHGGRMTAERENILKVTCNMKGHFHPEYLQEVLEEEGHAVALTTVYRNLPLLLEAKILRRACFADPEGRPDTATYEHVWGHEHHDHLICVKCGKKVEFTYPAIEILQEAVAAEHGFTLERHHMELIGTCPECKKRSGAFDGDLN